MSATRGRTFYRIVQVDPPTVLDFSSAQAKGAPPPADDGPHALAMWQGISVFATEAQARNKARTYPHLGTFIAVLVLPGGAGFEYRRTLQSRGHHTL